MFRNKTAKDVRTVLDRLETIKAYRPINWETILHTDPTTAGLDKIRVRIERLDKNVQLLRDLYRSRAMTEEQNEIVTIMANRQMRAVDHLTEQRDTITRWMHSNDNLFSLSAEG